MSMVIAQKSKPSDPVSRIREGSPILMALTLLFVIGFILTSLLGTVDDRLLNGVSVWEKPSKFYLSLAIHAATLSWGLGLLSSAERAEPAVRRAAFVFVIAAVGEMIWITMQAGRGQPSHYNDASMFTQIMYALMGVGAVTLTGVTIYLGYRIFRRAKGIMAYATGTGFMLAGILTTLVAAYMSQQSGHSVGGDATDASGLAFFHWSTTGGDLRVAHFAALHIAQAVPFAALIAPNRTAINLALAASTCIVAALFIQALLGIPFLRA